ncbi:MAG: hypothetical protein HY305_01085, partial [Sphingobacteriales bacterium]|nr:hypothetical protein [Sphingobacteriales bacterium]
PEKEYQQQLKKVLDKECLCVGLSNAAALKYDMPFIKNAEAVTICPSPNIAHFSQVVSLQTMTDHIYGRTNIMTDIERPNMFITELHLYINYLKEEMEEDVILGQTEQKKKFYDTFCKNLLDGIAYYRTLPLIKDASFEAALNNAEEALNSIALPQLV